MGAAGAWEPLRALEAVFLSEQGPALRGPAVGLSSLSPQGMKAGQLVGCLAALGEAARLKFLALIQGVSPESAPLTLAHQSHLLLLSGNYKRL